VEEVEEVEKVEKVGFFGGSVTRAKRWLSRTDYWCAPERRALGTNSLAFQSE